LELQAFGGVPNAASGAEPETLRVLYVGRLLLEGFASGHACSAEARKTMPQMKMTVIGSDPMEQLVSQSGTKLAVGDVVEWIPGCRSLKC